MSIGTWLPKSPQISSRNFSQPENWKRWSNPYNWFSQWGFAIPTTTGTRWVRYAQLLLVCGTNWRPKGYQSTEPLCNLYNYKRTLCCNTQQFFLAFAAQKILFKNRINLVCLCTGCVQHIWVQDVHRMCTGCVLILVHSWYTVKIWGWSLKKTST